MNKPYRIIHAAGAILALAASLHGQTAPAPAKDVVAETLGKGKTSLNVRARYENVDQTGLKDADAYTIRTRLGFTTAPLYGFKAMIEAENVTAIDGDRYSQAGLNPGGTGRAVVADPESSEINQAWVSYTLKKTSLTVGRQRLVLDNARFVGDVGWRQNMQTFDAAVLQDTSVDKLTITYAYLYQIDRVFSKRSTQGTWDSNSHLFNASYAGLPFTTVTGYAYLLDFDNAAANSCATYGLSFAGAVPVSKVKIAYRAEYARQSDYGSSTLDYSTDYYVGELGVVIKPLTAGLGYEVLGTDKNVGFKTPLATLHAFNGWADLFLATPAGGLRDKYAKVGATIPGAINLLAFYHKFETDTGIKLGDEYDVQVSRKFGKYLTGAVKYAAFDRDGTTSLVPESVKKLWVQMEFAF